MKSDRREMVYEFARIPGGFVGKMEGPGMRAVYNHSKFVPVGRGHASLNCFRIYEAASCGAVPVVVGPREEILRTFQDEGEYPWVTAESWSAAADKCRNLVGDDDAMGELQRRNLDWWRKRINEVRGLLYECLPEVAVPVS